MMNLPRSVSAVLLLAASALASRPARACTRPQCVPPTFPFAAGAVLPANVPYVPFFSDLDAKTGQPVHAELWRLVRDDGKAVDAELRMWRLLPKAPLEAGRGYQVQFPADCAAKPTVGTLAFKAGPAAGLDGTAPSDVGTLTITTSIERYQQPAQFCDPGPPRFIEKAAVARVRFTPSEATRPWTPVARMDFEVDRFNMAQFPGPEGILAHDPETVTTYVVDCSHPSGAFPGLGAHKLYAWFYVGDQRFPVPATAPFTLACDDTCDAGPPVVADGGAEPPTSPDAEAPDTQAPDAGAPDTRTPPTADSGSDSSPPDPSPPSQTVTPKSAMAEAGGCSLAPTAPAGLGALVLVTLGAALATRRRRR